MRVLAMVLVLMPAMAGALLPAVAGAEAWRALDGSAIKQALEGRELSYGNASQNFEFGGLTVYFADAPSSGEWRVDGNLYCSRWPPAEQWDCYGVEAKDGAVRFTGPDGTVTAGTYLDDPEPQATIMQ